MTSVKFLFRQQTTSVVIRRKAQTQFTDSLFPGNPVFIAVTLYLDYLLFRYFQYAFHLDDSFQIWRKSTEEIQAMLYVLGRTISYELMKEINGGTQMRDVWRLPAIAKWEKSCGKHPTQKPLCVLSRIIQASTKPGAWILDPFTGGSTTGIAATLLNRRFLGIDQSEKFLELSKARREELNDVKKRIEYIDRLQKQAKLFVDNEVRVLNDKQCYYGPELPF